MRCRRTLVHEPGDRRPGFLSARSQEVIVPEESGGAVPAAGSAAHRSRAETFGAALRRERLAAGMSLAGLAGEVHYSKGQLSKIETGRARGGPRLAYLCDVVLNAGGTLVAALTAEPGWTGRQSRRPGWIVRTALPPTVPDFVGREDELRQILAFLFDTGDASGPGLGRVCVVHGMPGVGKTTLAVRAAYRSVQAFPDGCVFLDLHGYTRGLAPVAPESALGRLLRMLDVPAEAIPSHVEDRAALFRDRLSGQRVLLLLDNALDSDQVRPMLPADGGCAVVVTSRRRLAALDHGEHVGVGPLSVAEGAALFRSVAGRAVAGPAGGEVLDGVVRRCGQLPLAVRIAAARLRQDPDSSIADLNRLLADDRTYLLELDDGERNAAAAFGTSFDGLSDGERQTLTTIAGHPGPDLGAVSAAAMIGLDAGEVRRRLDRLVAGHLLTRRLGGRYALHDLVRAYALHVADAAPADRLGPLRRLLDHYVQTASAADALIAPHRYRPQTAPDSGSPDLSVPASRAQAIEWMEAELDDLVAAVDAAVASGANRQGWQLAHALRGYFFLVKEWDRWIETHRLGITAARRDGAMAGEGHLLNGLGLAFFERGDVDAAAESYGRAQDLFTALGDGFGMSTTLGNMAWVHETRGDHSAAAQAHRVALRFYERTGAQHNSAITLRGLAVAEVGLKAYGEAVAHLVSARRTFADLRLPLDEAMTLNCLGDAHCAASDRAAAAHAYREAAEFARASGSGYEEARAHRGMAAVEADRAAARRDLAIALELYEGLTAPEADEVRAELTESIRADNS